MRLARVLGTSHPFDVEMVTLFPQSYGDNKAPFEFLITEYMAMAEFVVEDELVIRFGIFGAVGDLIKSRDRVEVWFDKIG
jgi:hypothetical protein